jgi:hypothetical protein
MQTSRDYFRTGHEIFWQVKNDDRLGYLGGYMASIYRRDRFPAVSPSVAPGRRWSDGGPSAYGSRVAGRGPVGVMPPPPPDTRYLLDAARLVKCYGPLWSRSQAGRTKVQKSVFD